MCIETHFYLEDADSLTAVTQKYLAIHDSDIKRLSQFPMHNDENESFPSDSIFKITIHSCRTNILNSAFELLVSIS